MKPNGLGRAAIGLAAAGFGALMVGGCALPAELYGSPTAGSVAGGGQPRPLSSDPLVVGARTVSTFLPPPAGAAVVLGAGLIASITRSKQLKAGAASIAAGIERAKREDPTFAEAFVRVKDHIRAPQTKSAETIVRAVKRSGDPRVAARGL
ncbi:MAG: hypothetical protein AAF297_09530 [Planctomycetota bacterium]